MQDFEAGAAEPHPQPSLSSCDRTAAAKPARVVEQSDRASRYTGGQIDFCAHGPSAASPASRKRVIDLPALKMPEDQDGFDKTHEVTRLLSAWRSGDVEARDRLLEVVYDQMRKLAASQLRRHRAGISIQPTELVHEVYLKLDSGKDFQDRGHFMALCATAMRHILIDAAKRRFAQKRGGGQAAVTLEEALLPSDDDIERVLAVEQALGRLGEIDQRLVQVVECRFFSGLTEKETAEALDVSSRTVNRDWLRARAWLSRTLGERGRNLEIDA